MADSKYTIADIDPALTSTEYRKVKLIDQGDGTYRLAVDTTGTFSTTATAASNVYGEIASLATSSTAVVASVPSAAAAYRFRGFTAYASGNARIYVEINGSEVCSAHTSIIERNPQIILPNGVDVSTGATIELKATNEAGSAISIEGTLLGEA